MVIAAFSMGAGQDGLDVVDVDDTVHAFVQVSWFFLPFWLYYVVFMMDSHGNGSRTFSIFQRNGLNSLAFLGKGICIFTGAEDSC